MSAPPSPVRRFDPLPPDLGARPAAAEEQVLAQWQAEQTFEALQAARAQAPAFVFWEGPPTANGRPGIHHVLARTLKDTVCRYQSMFGKQVERKAGWDTHGLPVELEVEKALSISGKPQIEKYGIAAFNAKCRESVWKYREEWERLSARIGYWLDYGHPYVTYAPEYVESVWALLAAFHRHGLVYRGKRVLPYCGRCGTGLSSHELGQPGVYQDVLDPSVHVRFPLVEPAGEERESLLAWTTTPWTLPSNVALAVHPEREYVRVRVPLPVAKGEAPGSAGHEILWLAAERAAAVLGKGFEEQARLSGRELAGRAYHAPYSARTPAARGFLPAAPWTPPEVDPGAWKPEAAAVHRVVLADYVTVEDGTGIVHQAPAYGADDWATAQRERLPVYVAVGPEGKFVVDVGGARAGTFFKEADDALMEDLKARGFLFRKSRENHSYPHCWRCSTALYYFAAPAWYIRTTAVKERMQASNATVQWVPPEVGTKRFGEWLSNNVDWNISRDRYWGTPLPFWVCDGCSAERAVGSAAELARLAGALPADFDHHRPSIDQPSFPCEKCAGTLRRTAAVLDCWFDSGAMPFAQHGWPLAPGSAERLAKQYPADFICEGLDQTRGWFYTLHAIGSLAQSIPELGLPAGGVYKSCLVNGLVLDKDGVKMSKRLGNVIDPWKVIEEHGADAVRWYLIASAAPWLAKKFDPAALAETRRRYFGTLQNSYGFLREYARIDKFDPQDPRIPSLAARPEIDRWLTSRAHSTIAEVRAGAAAYDLTRAARALEAFVVDELSNWYIRRNRRRFWKSESGADKLSAFATLHEALRTVALLSAPITPFFAEMLWRRLGGLGSVHQELLPESDAARIDRGLEGSMEIVQRLVVMGRALREKAGHRVRQPLRAIHVRASRPRDLELLGTGFASLQILDELNVKSFGSLGADDGKLCRLSAKANFKLLGKRLGGRMKAAALAIESLPAADLSRLRAGGLAEVVVEGETVQLTAEDVLVTVESQADFDVETDGRFVVWLDTALDDELLAEGFARESVNRINGLRKDRGLAIDERIELALHPGGEAPATLEAALRRHREFIGAEVLAVRVTVEPAAAPLPQGAESFDLGGGRSLGVVLTRAPGA
ncbi:MAG: isoleucine--tRNA ligase [Planctomycetes bacterium]|nr:isoleucine--tRNA ligase [Planctomycetota bacterium]